MVFCSRKRVELTEKFLFKAWQLELQDDFAGVAIEGHQAAVRGVTGQGLAGGHFHEPTEEADPLVEYGFDFLRGLGGRGVAGLRGSFRRGDGFVKRAVVLLTGDVEPVFGRWRSCG
jgi:hypothetical protein